MSNETETAITEMKGTLHLYKESTKDVIRKMLLKALEKNLDFLSSKRVKVILLCLIYIGVIMYYSIDYPVIADHLSTAMATVGGVCGAYVGGQSYIDRDKEKERWT